MRSMLSPAWLYFLAPSSFSSFVDTFSLSSSRQARRSTLLLGYHHQSASETAASTSDNNNNNNNAEAAAACNSRGLYRPFAEHAWSKLLQLMDDPSMTLAQDDSIPTELLTNSAIAKGFPEGSTVKMETRALQPVDKSNSKFRYARYALLETLVPSLSTTNNNGSAFNSTAGIQVLNLVIFPSSATNLPVFGADLVSLPGDKHLLLLDAQPMGNVSRVKHQNHWKDWHEHHVQPAFPWGGDIPEQVAQYVSDHALWTRFGKDDDKNAVEIIQTQLWDAFQKHLDLYLDLLATTTVEDDSTGLQEPYIQYRLKNDPARPMLKSLYGEEWTERVLQEVLFPNATTD
jgi:Ferredoxin-dependent bilin reductase